MTKRIHALGLAALRLLGVLLYRLGLARLVIRMSGSGPRVLLYHACQVEEGEFLRGRGLNVTPSQFADQVDFLRQHYQIVAAGDLLHARPADRGVVITFDEGFRSVYENAFPILRERNLPAVMFLVTDVVGNRGLMWLDELHWLLSRHGRVARPILSRTWGIPREMPVDEIGEWARLNYDRRMIASALVEIRRAAGIDIESVAAGAKLYLDWDEIHEMARHGFAFGNHTRTHPNLARLDAPAQRQEMSAAKEMVCQHLGGCIALAYPFGDHDSTSRRLAVELGHDLIMEVFGTNDPLDRLRIGRTPVHATSPAELFAEMEILAPLRARFRRVRSAWRELRRAASRCWKTPTG